MEPWQSWTIVGVASVGAYWYYNRQNNAKRRAGRSVSITEPGQAIRGGIDSKGRKRREKAPVTSDQLAEVAEGSSASLPNSGNEQVKKRKAGKKQSSQLATSAAINVAGDDAHKVDGDNDEDEVVNNKEFARQLSGLKAGASMTAPANASQPRKSKKGQGNGLLSPEASGATSEINNITNPRDISGKSSTTGADADDDLSRSNSPTLSATQASSGQGGVSDMLEGPTPGPSILRLTEPVQPQRVSQPRQQKSFQVQETKKQRQNRQKTEAKRLEREQSERERRVLLEKQLRTAREAEGRPARNGVTSPKPPTANPWAASNGSFTRISSVPAGANADAAPLLDTFEESTTAVTSGTNENKVNGASSAIREKAWGHDLPSEEEQMRILSEIEGDGGWNTVEKAKKRKGKTNGNEIVNEISKEDMPTAEKKSTNVFVKGTLLGNDSSDENGYKDGKYVPFADTGHPLDSDWAVE
ncbi:hypothetical protein MMC24_007081 [Lignoscripta atroalba]|nr:hypothetical protein [Lignoscripta atroalba]